MAGALGQGRERGPHVVGLPADVEHDIPVTTRHLGVRSGGGPVGPHPGDTVRWGARLTTGEAGHAVAAGERVPGHGTAQPRGAAEHEQVKGER